MSEPPAKIMISRYDLQPRRDLNARAGQKARSGALLRIEFGAGLIGFADCHPWTEFGDSPIDAQLEALKKNQPTNLLKRSLIYAELDAHARAEKRSLWAGAGVPLSHANLVPSEVSKDHLARLKDQGFSTIKLKFSPLQMNSWSPIEYLIRTHPHFSWRLDFNASFNSKTAFAFLAALSPDVLARIEFVEDPSPFNTVEWSKLQSRSHCTIAADFESGEGDFRARVIKPAVQDAVSFIETAVENLIVTSYMDHPLGQCAAAWSASELAKKAPTRSRQAGLQSHMVYERTPFSERLQWNSPIWKPPEGTGFGFDDLLAELEWTALS